MNREVMKQQKDSCFSSSTTFNDDLFTGACMAEAHMVGRSHPCFLTYDKELFWTRRRTGLPEEGLLQLTMNRRCECPVLVHKVKDALHRYHVARRLQRICKYKKVVEQQVGGSAAAKTGSTANASLEHLEELLTHFVEDGRGLYDGLRRGCVARVQ